MKWDFMLANKTFVIKDDLYKRKKKAVRSR
jgi:hypothetical protein